VEVENGRRGEEEAEKKKNKSDLIQQVQLSVGGVPGVSCGSVGSWHFYKCNLQVYVKKTCRGNG